MGGWLERAPSGRAERDAARADAVSEAEPDYCSTWRQDGHRATATPTPMETIKSRVSVSPMRKRRID